MTDPALVGLELRLARRRVEWLTGRDEVAEAGALDDVEAAAERLAAASVKFGEDRADE